MQRNTFRLSASTLAYMGCDDYPERVALVARRGVPGTPWVANYENLELAKREAEKYSFIASHDLELVSELQRIIFIAIDTGPLVTVNVIGCPPGIHGILENIFKLGSMVCIAKKKVLSLRE